MQRQGRRGCAAGPAVGVGVVRLEGSLVDRLAAEDVRAACCFEPRRALQLAYEVGGGGDSRDGGSGRGHGSGRRSGSGLHGYLGIHHLSPAPAPAPAAAAAGALVGAQSGRVTSKRCRYRDV